jgi:pantoate--beta-alanine ligase
VRESSRQNDVSIASIFVNPKQFGPNEDFSRYPRQLERDVQLLQDLGVHHILAPASSDMLYGPQHATTVSVAGLEKSAEGRARPGHFAGVATVVTKLFNIVRPTSAYFGQKDAAQCVLIRRIVEDLDMDINVVVQETVREADGLALSSRNAYLTTAERQAAPVLYKALQAAQELFATGDGGADGNGENNSSSPQSEADGALPDVIPAADLRKVVEATLRSEPLVSQIQYISVDNPATMQPLQKVWREKGAILSLACKVGSVRLIDNVVLK